MMTMAEVVAEDAVEGGETGSGTGEEDGLVKIAGGVEAVAGGALEGNGGAEFGFGESVAHGSSGNAADVEFEILTGDGVAAGEAVVAEESEILAGSMVDRFGGGEVDLHDGVAEPSEVRDEGGGRGLRGHGRRGRALVGEAASERSMTASKCELLRPRATRWAWPRRISWPE